MDRSVLARHALPAGLLGLVAALDVALGREQVVLGLMGLAPLLAAAVLSRRATALYGMAAVAGTALLGIYDRQYTADAVAAQGVRLVLLTLAAVVAVAACTLRVRQEQRLTQLAVEAARARGILQLAETLQRSMLTDPPPVPSLEIAVRYLPAVRHAQVGGDWYDAFPLPSGATMLAIGDVAGHDGSAAATMAQARGMLRGIAQTGTGSPAAVLRALDGALENLRMPTLITLALATVDDAPGSAGRLRLCWSNAGHPPPVLLRAAGTTELLEDQPERLLGAGAGAVRSDHQVPLDPGDTVLFYTDGLVERRGVPIDEGTAWLVEELRAHGAGPLEEVCDAVLEGLSGGVDDDVALLAVRVRSRRCADPGSHSME